MEKIIIALDSAIPGMVTAEPVLSNEKQIILQSNTEITSHMINLLNKWEVDSICVKQIAESDKVNCYSNTYFSQRDQEIEVSILIVKYSEVSSKSKSLFEYIRNNQYLPYDIFYELAYNDLYELINEKNILAYMYKFKPRVDYSYLHAVNVGIIAGLIGLWYGFDRETVKSLILAGLMHDIGKVKIPQAILDKGGQLSIDELEVLKLHPVYGYHMVKDIKNIAPEIQYAILQHHKRDNGRGYPKGLYNNSGIHYFAKVVAIANFYDVMTSNCIYKDSVTPFAALEVLTNKMFMQYDGEFCKIFIRNAICALTNSTVLLSDKTQAQVLCFGCFMSTNPVVKKSDGTLLDLNETEDVSIVEVVKFA